jgi:hypothetical protein
MNDFEEYIRQGEPGKKEKGIIWQMAIGLQQVDGLKPSAYLIETAIENNIKKLREKGIISRVGSDKTGSWKILEKEGNNEQ